MPDGTREPRREPDPDDDGESMTEEYLHCTGRRRRFLLQSYADDTFLSATELLSNDQGGMRIVMKMDEHGHLPWGEMRDRIRRRLTERDVAVDPETDELAILNRRVRAQLVGFDGDEPLLVVDDRPVMWSELGRMLESFEGWGLELRVLDATEE